LLVVTSPQGAALRQRVLEHSVPPMRGRHHPDPRDQSPPQTDLASDRQNCAVSFRYRDLPFCVLPQLCGCRSATKELFAHRSGACDVLLRTKSGRTSLLLQGENRGAVCRLRYANGPAALMKRD
jgi:hypothetical protein